MLVRVLVSAQVFLIHLVFAHMLVETAQLRYLTLCFKILLCCISEARSTNETGAFAVSVIWNLLAF